MKSRAEKIRADELKHALSKRHTDDLFLTEVKTGATWSNNELLKFDAFAIRRSWANPCLYGYEVKVSRQDFLNDQKWPGYMKSCNKFSFVCPKGLIQPEELTEEVGLLWYYPESGAIVSKRSAKHRIIEMPKDLFFYILISRTTQDRHPFFSTAREMAEAYLQDKIGTAELAQELKTKLLHNVALLDAQKASLEREIEQQKREVDFAKKVKHMLKQHGMSAYYDSHTLEELRKRLSSGVSEEVNFTLLKLEQNVETLKKLLSAKGEDQT